MMSNFKARFAHMEFRKRIEEEMVAFGYTMDDLHLNSGVSSGSLARLMYGNHVSKIEVILSVAKVLQIDYTMYITYWE